MKLLILTFASVLTLALNAHATGPGGKIVFKAEPESCTPSGAVKELVQREAGRNFEIEIQSTTIQAINGQMDKATATIIHHRTKSFVEKAQGLLGDYESDLHPQRLADEEPEITRESFILHHTSSCMYAERPVAKPQERPVAAAVTHEASYGSSGSDSGSSDAGSEGLR